MSSQTLRMKYHPAKKEISFQRFAAGKMIPIRNDSKLYAYMNKRGKFILQDHGNRFFEDIAEAFDGEKSVDIEVITTKNDYEDLLQMIEYYNGDANVKITATLLSELPNMEDTYSVVRDHGEKSIAILQKHKTRFFDMPLDNPDIKKCVEMFSSEVQQEVNSIREKIDSMSDNSVNLCFAGVYSAGKSALINAILGYQILPEAIKSETSRMFKIQSPKDAEKVRIVFRIRDNFAELIWEEASSIFIFGAAPTEDVTRKTIQETVNTNSKEPQHRQIYEILKTLNTNDDVSAKIDIYFPIPLDSSLVQFTIFDTPGTDSNFGEHQTILQDALSEQTHSILIFVAAPNKTEGEGNNALLSYLKEAEKKDSKTSIDIGRSLFVINWADSIGPEERLELQKAKIKDKQDEDFSIKLSDKKLFFTSAKVAYAAKAKENGIASKGEEFTIKQQSATISDEYFGRFYRQDRIASSEFATHVLIERCDKALAVADEKKDILDVLWICSGLFALTSEITTYGEKYAAAVRAYAIIDSVDKALSAMNKNARSLERQNQEDINKIKHEITELKNTLVTSIREACRKYEYPENDPLPSDVLQTLHLDSEYLSENIQGKALSFIDKLLGGWFFGLGKTKYKKKDKEKITEFLASVISDFTREFLKNRQELLEQRRDACICDVKHSIQANGNISDDAKNFVCAIRPPEVKKYKNAEEFGEMYDSNKRVDKFLWMDTFHVDRASFREDADGKLTKITSGMATDFTNDFRSTLSSTLSTVEAEFSQNIEKYSILMQARLADKKALEQLRSKIVDACKELSSCQDELNQMIWSVKSDG